MAKIHFVDHTGEKRTIEVENGATVMEAAIRNAIPGIEAECGGACACATCHVYVDEAWREKVGSPSPMEEDMLDFGFDVRPSSRLSCQIKVNGRPEVRKTFSAIRRSRAGRPQQHRVRTGLPSPSECVDPRDRNGLAISRCRRSAPPTSPRLSCRHCSAANPALKIR